jgi:hypothetical protein
MGTNGRNALHESTHEVTKRRHFTRYGVDVSTTNPNSTWADWLRGQLDKRTWRAADLARASGTLANGRERISRERVSVWLSGREGATWDMVVAVARALDADLDEALNAAGHDDVPPAVAAALDEIRNAPPPADLRAWPTADLVTELYRRFGEDGSQPRVALTGSKRWEDLTADERDAIVAAADAADRDADQTRHQPANQADGRTPR